MSDDEADRDLTATYADSQSARDAVKRLERKGIEGSDVAVLGEANKVTKQSDNQLRDERMLTYAFRSSLAGFGIGSAVGALLGVVVGGVLFGWWSGAMLGTVGGGLFLGGGLGILVAGIVQLPQSDAGLALVENEFEGEVTLGIHTDATGATTTEEAVESTHPERIDHVPDDVRERPAEHEDAGPPPTTTGTVDDPPRGTG